MKGYIADLTHIKDVQTTLALSEVLLRNVPEDTIILQFSSTQRPYISLGQDDMLVDNFQKGLSYFRRNGYSVHFRNFGNRSIVFDPGVLNVSWYMKSTQSGTERYHLFYKFFTEALKDLNLEFDLGLIQGAYAPGTYDISVAGKKVAGIYQGKVGESAQIGCYLSVNGDQVARSETMKRFYEATGNDLEISSHKMATLEDLVLHPLTIPNITTLLIAQFREAVDSLSFFDIDALEDSEEFRTVKDRIINQDKRNFPTSQKTESADK